MAAACGALGGRALYRIPPLGPLAGAREAQGSGSPTPAAEHRQIQEDSGCDDDVPLVFAPPEDLDEEFEEKQEDDAADEVEEELLVDSGVAVTPIKNVAVMPIMLRTGCINAVPAVKLFTRVAFASLLVGVRA